MSVEDYKLEIKEDFNTDEILIKVTKRTGNGPKEGVILVLQEQALFQMAEGNVYPRRVIRGWK